MATFKSTGHTVFREGDPAIPDISGEKKGRAGIAADRGAAKSRRLRRVTTRGRFAGRFLSALLGRSR